jgi:RsiW-degrading membrane proteinase PrsW (M82 family)
MCCLALCNPQKQKSKAWIGYLLFGILILIIAIAWHRYKKPAQSEPLALALHKKPHP